MTSAVGVDFRDQLSQHIFCFIVVDLTGTGCHVATAAIGQAEFADIGLELDPISLDTELA